MRPNPGLVAVTTLSLLAALPFAARGGETTVVSIGLPNALSVVRVGGMTPDARFLSLDTQESTLVPGDDNGFEDVFVRDRKKGLTTRVSVASDGAQTDDHSGGSRLSDDGRVVAFWSDATNLVAGDGNGQRDIFVHDRETGLTNRVSVDTNGVEANGESRNPAISADGRYVAFSSAATNLVAGDGNTAWDTFVHDRVTATTARVSVDSAGVEGDGDSTDLFGFGAPSISTDGRYVSFESLATNLVANDTNAVRDVFVRDRMAGVTARVTVASSGDQSFNQSRFAAMSADGRHVVFASSSSALVPGAFNGTDQLFAHDRKTGVTTHLSFGTAGEPALGGAWFPTVSADGRYVTFLTEAANLVPNDTNGTWDIFVHDRKKGKTTRASVASSGVESGAVNVTISAVSANGRFVAFDSLADAAEDGLGRGAFLRDRKKSKTTRASTPVLLPPSDGNLYGALSWNARYVAFTGRINLAGGPTSITDDVYVHDRKKRVTTRVSVDATGAKGNNSSLRPALSGNGRFVAFDSDASNLVDGDGNGTTDVFVHDRKKGKTTRVSVDSSGGELSDISMEAAISANGRFVTFQSGPSFLEAVFVHDRKTGHTTQVSIASDGSPQSPGSRSVRPAISEDGRFLAFASSASNLVPGDTNLTFDVFVHDRKKGKTTRVSVDSAGSEVAVAATALAAPALSANGRYVAFESASDDFDPDDSNGLRDIILHDRKTGMTTRISTSHDGSTEDGDSRSPRISPNGRIVAFQSTATNLVPGDTNGVADIFAYDRKTGELTRLSVDSAGVESNGSGSNVGGLSEKGDYATFWSDADNLDPSTQGGFNVFIRER